MGAALWIAGGLSHTYVAGEGGATSAMDVCDMNAPPSDRCANVRYSYIEIRF